VDTGRPDFLPQGKFTGGRKKKFEVIIFAMIKYPVSKLKNAQEGRFHNVKIITAKIFVEHVSSSIELC
jgi:hypothetical protein